VSLTAAAIDENFVYRFLMSIPMLLFLISLAGVGVALPKGAMDVTIRTH
jgi:hypothetical protein